ncbi:MAG: tyrosinase family protein [Bacteroidetes bacterium]|nr:tyrosinase family protein [Bacteroidota bacterium]
MNNFIRKNAWDACNGGQFKDQSGNYTDLYWYAKGVEAMKALPINNAVSWWFYGAIHGQYLIATAHSDPAPASFPNWTKIASIPASANLNNPPAQSLANLFWDQCQHGSWFFPPWHRGYLVALENILRDIIISLNGPADWALPYWNYLNQSQTYKEYQIPPAFTVSALPDGTSNPLYIPERYGPNGDKNIYIVVGPDTQQDPSANDECQWDTIYGDLIQPAQPGPGDLTGYYYGGMQTGFSHDPAGFGDLESNPHNFAHVMIGGFNGDAWTDPNPAEQTEGLMSDPGVAALDPVFYLHHANIDRMWTAWNVTGKNANPSNANWQAGPTANGNSQFAMPVDAKGTPWYYTPADVNSTTQITFMGNGYSYTYDDLSLTSYDTTPPSKMQATISNRLIKLGGKGLDKGTHMEQNTKPELVGASDTALTLNSGTTQTAVKLNTTAWKSVSKSLLKASVSTPPNDVYLQLENVKGTNNANFLSLYINDNFVQSVALFGIRMASMKNSAHGGAGLTFKFNITNVIDNLHLGSGLDFSSLNVQIKTRNPIPKGSEITVGRISIYRLSQ